MPTHAVLQVEPRPDGDFRVVDTELGHGDHVDVSRWYVDGLGNACRRLTLPTGRSVVRFDAHVDVSPETDAFDFSTPEVPPEALPDAVLAYTLPSRFCPSDEFGALAWDLFATVPPGWSRVQTISDWVHNEVAFTYDERVDGDRARRARHRAGACVTTPRTSA